MPKKDAAAQTETAAKTAVTDVKKVPNRLFKVKKNLTLPLLKMSLEQEYFVKFTGAPFLGKEIAAKEGSETKKPPMIVDIINLEDGEQMQLMLNKVLLGTLEETYPDNGFVGMDFRLVKHAKKSGKEYHTFSIGELELEDGNEAN